RHRRPRRRATTITVHHTATAISPCFMPTTATHMRGPRSSMGMILMAPPAIGSTTAPADRAAATTRNRRDECSKGYFGFDSAGRRGGYRLPDADAKLGEEPAKLRTEFAGRRRYFRRAL